MIRYVVSKIIFFFKKTFETETQFLSLGALSIVLFGNHVLLGFILQSETGGLLSSLLIKTVLICTLYLAIWMVLLIGYLLNLSKITFLVMFTLAVCADYFMKKYGVMIDSSMFESAVHTNYIEVSQYFEIEMMIFVFMMSALIFTVFKLFKFPKSLFTERLLFAAKGYLLSFLFLTLCVGSYSKGFTSYVRNNRQITHMANPVNVIFEASSYVKSKLFPKDRTFHSIASGAKYVGSDNSINVMVVGETVRFDHLSISGYEKNTTPYLKSLGDNFINFGKTQACGTSTATSVPCIFSHKGRSDFDKELAPNYENLLDFAKKSGYEVFWIDNNSGCQGLCGRVNFISTYKSKDPDLCSSGGCYDEIMLEKFREIKFDKNKKYLIVFHMLGSHGPTYYKRYPDTFKKFKPTCNTSSLDACSKQEVVNTYDNTIVYLDHFLKKLTLDLKHVKTKHIKNMLYTSDHGESLGEGGVYLHSLPYSFAPKAQKEVPLFYWGPGYFNKELLGTKLTGKSEDILNLSHDNLFHTMLGVLKIDTQFYIKSKDLLRIDGHSSSVTNISGK